MIINPVISASGGLKPQIIVTAPTGSTVTCTTPGGLTIQGIEASGTWTFPDLPGLGTYTVNASNGAQSRTENVAVDRIGVYQVPIIYRLYLYNEGNEYTSLTGGYIATSARLDGWNWYGGYAPTLTKTNVLSIKQSSNIRFGTVSTANAINMSGYSRICIALQYNIGKVIGDCGFRILLSSSRNDSYPNDKTILNVESRAGAAIFDGTVEAGISSITGEKYLNIFSFRDNAGVDNTVNISQIWLE